jgi:hypothetical protein
MTGHGILQFNGLTTLGCAAAILATRANLAPLFGLATPRLLDIIAVGLLVYGAALLIAARQRPVAREVLLAFTAADALWVAGSAGVLIAYWANLAPIARILIVVVALIVEVLATLQFRAAGGWGGREARVTA